MNLLIKSYLKKYFKNIEKFDFSLINGKVKIDSVVPKLDTFTNLLNLEKLNLKIENGLIKDLTINFPINILKNPVKIFIKNVDIYITSTNGFKDCFLSGLNESKRSSDLLPTDKKTLNIVESEDDSFWLKVKDDIIANIIVEIENINLYIFLKDYILKGEIKNILLSPSVFNNTNDFQQTFINDAKNGNYRKYLSFESIRASIDTKMEEITKQDRYVIKNMKLYFIFDFMTQQKKRRNKIVLENFLFDSDISDFGKLVGIVQDFLEIVYKNKIEDQKDKDNDCSFDSDKYSQVSSEFIFDSETTFLAENTNINFTYNVEKILFYFILNNFEFTVNYLNEKRVKFDNLYIFLPIMKNLDNTQRSSVFNSNLQSLNTNINNFSDFIKIGLKDYNDHKIQKTFSFNAKLIIDKRKFNLLSDQINIKHYKTNNKISTNNVILKIDLNHLKWIIFSLNNLYYTFKQKVDLSRSLSKYNQKESFLEESADNNNMKSMKIPLINLSLGKHSYFNNDVKYFMEIMSIKLFTNRLSFDSTWRILHFSNENEINIVNLLTQKNYKILEGVKIEYRFESNTHNIGFRNSNFNISSYSINFLISLNELITKCMKMTNQQLQSSKDKSLMNMINTPFEENKNEFRTFFSYLNNCTSYIFEISVLGNEHLNYLLKPFEEREFVYKMIRLKLNINDTNFECLLDISQIFMNLAWNENNQDHKNTQYNYKGEEIDFIKISLVDIDQREKNFFLFYQYEKSTKSILNLFIFDHYIIIHNFPSPSIYDIKKFLTSNPEITSNFELMYENSLQNIKISNVNESPILCFVCDNFLFRNFFNFEIELEIGYEDSKEIIAIPPREEKSVLIFLDRLKYAYFLMKNYKHFKGTNLVSEDLSEFIRVKKISNDSMKHYFKVYHNVAGKKQLTNNKIFNLLVTMDDFNLVFKLPQDTTSKMKIVNLMPTVIIRNITSIGRFYVCFNNFSDKIGQGKVTFEKKNNETESSDFQIDFENNIIEIVRGDNTLTLNDDLLNKLKIGISLGDNTYHFSQSLFIKNKQSLIFSIKLDDHNNLLSKFLIFRIKIKVQNLNIVLLTVSSFLNFSINSSSITRLFVQNKYSESLEDKHDSSTITTTSDIATDFTFVFDKSYYKKNFIFDGDNVFEVVELIRSFKNKLDLVIEDKNAAESNIFFSGVSFKDIFLKDVYCLNTINFEYLSESDKKSLLKEEEVQTPWLNETKNQSLKRFLLDIQKRERNNADFEIKNKVYNLRFVNSPFYVFEVCDFFKTNNYIYIENISSYNVLFSINGHYNFFSEGKTVSEFSVEKIETFFVYMVEFGKKNFKLDHPLHIVKYEKFVESNQIKFFEDKILMEISKKINKIHIKIYNNNDQEVYKYKQTFTSNQISLFFDISDLKLNFDFIPFFLDIKSPSLKKEMKFYLESPKILGNFILTKNTCLSNKMNLIKPKYSNYYMSINLVNFKIYKYINDSQFDYVIKTKYMTDFKLNFELLYNEIRSDYLINFIKVSFPIETDIFIDDILSQIALFINNQINDVSERNFVNVKFNEDVKILDFLNVPKIQTIYTLEEFLLNEFLINFSVEMKKGISISVTNSSIKTQSVKLKNLVGNLRNFSDEIKSNIFKNLINHIYNLLTSAEMFGNFNQLYNEISEGFRKFVEKPFTTGIFSLFYSSIKGSFKSIYGIGRSIGKTLIFTKNTIFEKKINELYKETLYNQVNSNLLNIIYQQIINTENSNLVLKFDKKNLSDLLKDERQIRILLFQEIELCSQFFVESNLSSFFTEEIKYILFSKNRSDRFIVVLTNYYFCIATLKDTIKVEYLIPFMQINGLGVFNNRLSISLKNGNKIEINLLKKKFKDIMKYELLDKFDDISKT